MKKPLIFLLLLFFSIITFAQPAKFSDLIGKWQVAGEKESGASLEIIDSSRLFLTYLGERRPILDYTFDFTRHPYWFDFTIQDTSGVIKVKSIIQKVNDTVIKWQLFLNEERSGYFTSSRGELFYLTKLRTAPQSLTSKQ
jgi:hypothetical protein